MHIIMLLEVLHCVGSIYLRHLGEIDDSMDIVDYAFPKRNNLYRD